jgi:hypothetical protein
LVAANHYCVELAGGVLVGEHACVDRLGIDGQVTEHETFEQLPERFGVGDESLGRCAHGSDSK